MRIRKNAKLSPLLFTTTTTSSRGGGSVPVTTPTHVCQLNQSPWDVIPFDSDSFQFKDDHDSGNNGSAGDSFGAAVDRNLHTKNACYSSATSSIGLSGNSAASMMEDTEEKLKIQDMVLYDDNQQGKKAVTDSNGERGAARISCCQGIDERGWPCKNRVKQGQSSLLCGHHLSLLRSYNNAVSRGGGYGKKAPHSSAAAAVTGRRGRGAAKKSPSSKPFEFYYYSGFGPRWGKRRGDRNGDGSVNRGFTGEDSTMAESEEAIAGSEIVVAADDSDSNNNHVRDVVVHGIGNGVFDFVEDDDDEEDCDDDDGGGKKRMRRPVKERSLKSLM